MSGGVYAKIRREVKDGETELMDAGRDEPLSVFSGIAGDEEEGFMCGTIPAIIDSTWKTAVISTKNGGKDEDTSWGDFGLFRIRATLI